MQLLFDHLLGLEQICINANMKNKIFKMVYWTADWS